MDKFQIFELNFKGRDLSEFREIEEEFHKFFYKYNLTALFTNEHRVPPISVSWAEARSVIASSGKFSVRDGERVEHGGAYHETLKQFGDILSIANDNKSFEEAIFKVIYNAGTFRVFMNRIKKLIDYYSQVKEEHKFNFWNIVFYNKEVY